MFTTKYKSHSLTPKSILCITQIITKAFKSLSSIKLYLSAQFQCLTFLPNQKGQGCAYCQTFELHNAMCTILSSEKKRFYLLSPYWSQECVKGQNICLHGVIYFVLINLIMQHDYFQKGKQINYVTPSQGSRVSVRAKYLLTYYCTLHSL